MLRGRKREAPSKLMAGARAEAYRIELSRVFGRRLKTKDGVPEPRLRKAEMRLGFPLPEAMRDFYRVAGAARETRRHNLLFPPEGLEVEQGHLVFMQENQAVVDWGIPRKVIKKPDPPVWQRVNGEKPKWYSEKMVFSVFIVRNLAWQLGVGGPA